MNKSQLVDALTDRLGDRRTAATAVDALLQIVVDTVRSGDSVSLAGFGVFESRARAARTGRNPRTGESVAVAATTVPAFRPGTGFRNAVAGDDAPVTTDAAPARRRSRPAAATNGSGGTAVARNGSSELPAPSTATQLGTPEDTPAKGKKKDRPAKAPSKNAKDKNAKDKNAKDKNANDADKAKKKGKKGK
jgi:DNA-binding protein HU-beta